VGEEEVVGGKVPLVKRTQWSVVRKAIVMGKMRKEEMAGENGSGSGSGEEGTLQGKAVSQAHRSPSQVRFRLV